MTRLAIYAGTFDPITKGHLDIIERSKYLCDSLVIAIGENPAKKTLFSVEERIKMILELNVTSNVYSFQGLLINYARELGANILIRGIRSVSDFEYELNLANINSSLAPDIQTIFLPTKPELGIISSSAVKELARYNAPIHNMVCDNVAQEVYKKLGVNA